VKKLWIRSASSGKVALARRRQVSLNDRMRSTQRFPFSLRVPRLRFRHGTAKRSARSARLLVGSTPSCARKVHSESSRRTIRRASLPASFYVTGHPIIELTRHPDLRTRPPDMKVTWWQTPEREDVAMKIEREGRMTIRHLCNKGVSNREVARLLGLAKVRCVIIEADNSMAALMVAAGNLIWPRVGVKRSPTTLPASVRRVP